MIIIENNRIEFGGFRMKNIAEINASPRSGWNT